MHWGKRKSHLPCGSLVMTTPGGSIEHRLRLNAEAESRVDKGLLFWPIKGALPTRTIAVAAFSELAFLPAVSMGVAI